MRWLYFLPEKTKVMTNIQEKGALLSEETGIPQQTVIKT